MTDNEIIKALECCVKSETTDDCKRLACPAFGKDGCIYINRVNISDESFFVEIGKDLVSVIRRQQADKQNLEIELKAMRGAANFYKAEIESLKEENDKWKTLDKLVEELERREK